MARRRPYVPPPNPFPTGGVYERGATPREMAADPYVQGRGAYSAGIRAFKDNLAVHANPHPVGSDDHMEWARGFHDRSTRGPGS